MTSDDEPRAAASNRGVDVDIHHGHTLPLTSSPGGQRGGRPVTDGGRAVESLRGAIIAAEVAVYERQLDRAEDALLKALGQTRKLKALEGER